MHRHRLALALLIAFAASACVRQSTYDALKKTSETQAARITELEEALAKEKAALDALQVERDQLAQRVAELEQTRTHLLKDQSDLEASMVDLQLALTELERRKKEAEARVNEFRALLDRFKPLMDAGRLRVKIVDGRMVVELATDVLFASGKARLSKDGKEAIVEVAKLLADIPDRRFQVEGHTDNVPIRNSRFPSNWELAAARALTVVQTMVEAGLAPQRVSGASYAEFKPAATNETDEGRAANRRIEIVVVPDLSTLPGFEELKELGGGA
ncbi:MAG: OmpA family protein [Myxococcales bacterium]|nr:OmpA family protein [Myxococcales bacterium]